MGDNNDRPAHTRTLSSSHGTRSRSSSNAQAPARAQATIQTNNLAIASHHTQPLTSIPTDLPQLMVTTPTTIYSAYTSQSTPSSFESNGTPFSPPTQVPDVSEPTASEEPRRVEPVREVELDLEAPFAPKLKHILPEVIVTPTARDDYDGSDEDVSPPSPAPPRPAFASLGTANPNAPVLPPISVSTSAGPTQPLIVRKPVPAATIAAVERVRAPGKAYSPPGKASPPSAGARTFSAVRRTPRTAQYARGPNDSPTPATAAMYVQSILVSNNAVRGTGAGTTERVVGRETLFDLDADARGMGVEAVDMEDDAREIPLDDVPPQDLPEYIQVYLTPHPDQDDNEKDGAGDKEKVEYERRNKWSDVEASLPAYKSRASLGSSSGSSGAGSESPRNSKHGSTRKVSRRAIWILVMAFVILIAGGAAFGVVYGMSKAKHHHDSATGAPVDAPVAGSQDIARAQHAGPSPDRRAVLWPSSHRETETDDDEHAFIPGRIPSSVRARMFASRRRAAPFNGAT